MPQLGKGLIIIGLIIVAIGIILWLAGNKFTWLGNLPGDIKVEKENFRFYMPITTMILLSVIVSFAVWLFKKFF